jgi:hypothetical protein
MIKSIVWIGSAWKGLKAFPDEVKKVMGMRCMKRNLDERPFQPSLCPGSAAQAFSKLSKIIRPTHTAACTP